MCYGLTYYADVYSDVLQCSVLSVTKKRYCSYIAIAIYMFATEYYNLWDEFSSQWSVKIDRMDHNVYLCIHKDLHS